MIGERYGMRVACIVKACTDADTVPKPPWRSRKEAYLTHLEQVDPDVLLVSCADKLHNVHSICTDLQTFGSAVFDRCKGGQESTIWNYVTLSDVFSRRLPGPIAIELRLAVDELCRLSSNKDEPLLGDADQQAA